MIGRLPRWAVRVATGIVAPALFFGVIAAGLLPGGFGWLSPLPRAVALDYSRGPVGGFEPLSAPYLSRILGGAETFDEAAAQQSRGSGVGLSNFTGFSGDTRTLDRRPFTNDDFSGAQSIPRVPYDTTTETTGATREKSEPTSCSAIGGTVWYRYTSMRTEGLVATTEGTRYADSLAVFTGSELRALDSVACKTSPSGAANVAFPAVAGATYYFQVTAPLVGGHLVFGLHRRDVVSLGSMTHQSTAADGRVWEPKISSDGRWVAFQSAASNLDPQCPCRPQVYIRDMLTGRVELVSVARNGAPANAGGGFGEGADGISSDGRYVAFSSSASNLVPGDTNGVQDVFVRDRIRRITTRVSVGPGGRQGTDRSFHSRLTADGRYVTWWGDAFGLDPTYPDARGIYWRDLRNGVTKLVSVSSGGVPANGSAVAPDISADGNVVSFLSDASNLTPEGPGPFMTTVNTGNRTSERLHPYGVYNADWWVESVYVHNVLTGRTMMACTSSDGRPSEGGCDAGALSRDGRFVAIVSSAVDLIPTSEIPAEEAGLVQVYVKDLMTQKIELVSRSSSGQAGGDFGGSLWGCPGIRELALNGVHDPRRTGENLNRFASISGDGRFVAFDSESPNLLDDGADTNGIQDVFVHDRLTGKTTRVSLTADGHEASEPSYGSEIAEDGRSVVFLSQASLAPDSPSTWPQAYVWIAG